MRTPGESEATADHAKQGSGSSSGRNVATSHHAGRTSLLRDRTDKRTATNVALFFDLVYVFAITQLSRTLLAAPTAHQALRSALLFAIVWLVWAYTTWVTNFL